MGELSIAMIPRLRATALLIVIRYVGNTMATFVLQSLGCDVAALNTVHFSRPTISHKELGWRNLPDLSPHPHCSAANDTMITWNQAITPATAK